MSYQYKTPRPAGKRWENAKLYRVGLYHQRFPVCGLHLVWVLKGHKHVRCCIPIQNDKFSMPRVLFDQIYNEEFVPCTQ